MRELKVTLLAAFLFSLLCSSLIYSQEKTTEYNPLAENRWSVIFEVGTFLNNYGNSAYKSFCLSGKYHFNKRNGARLSIATDGGFSRRSSSHGYEFWNNTADFGEGLSIESDLHYVHYLNADSKIKVYLGIGPYFNLEHSYRDLADYQGYITTSAKRDDYKIGLSAALGLEYFILDNISLVGEYYCTGYYSQSVDTNIDYSYYISEIRSLSHGWAYDISRMRMGFSVYF